jgi:adenylate cyclase
MAREIERKFLVKRDAWVPRDPGVPFTQGYLSSQKERVVRVRLEGTVAKLTVKGLTSGISRLEFEYDIPATDAVEMLDALCERPLISKHRHMETHDGLIWEIDVFHGENDGLIVAEVELPSEHTDIILPAWAGEDVSSNPRYFNANLIAHPFRDWD